MFSVHEIPVVEKETASEVPVRLVIEIWQIFGIIWTSRCMGSVSNCRNTLGTSVWGATFVAKLKVASFSATCSSSISI
jgi:hypothetical protein